jgi:tRNA nucleotidyltransferase (CCA-adding enzyme)
MTFLDRVDIFMQGLDAETYRVGGSVRDELLGRPCKDADYMVCGLSLANMRMRLRAMRPDTCSPLKLRDGRQVGWRVSKKGLGLIEIAMPRTEVSTGPGRQDFEIVVDPDLPLWGGRRAPRLHVQRAVPRHPRHRRDG